MSPERSVTYVSERTGLGGWRVNNMMVIVLFTLLILLMFGGVVYKLIPETTAAGGTPSATAGEPKPADARNVW